MTSVRNEEEGPGGDSESSEAEEDSEEDSEVGEGGHMEVEESSENDNNTAPPLEADRPPDFNSDEDATQSDSDSETQSSGRSRRSLAPSPTDSLAEHAAKLSISADPLDPPPDTSLTPDITHKTPSNTNTTLKERVSADVARHKAQQNKFHSKRSARKIGRPKGSKAKQDTRIKVEKGGVWE